MTTMALMHRIRVWAHPQWAEMGVIFSEDGPVAIGRVFQLPLLGLSELRRGSLQAGDEFNIIQ